jgi:hypothetical protein
MKALWGHTIFVVSEKKGFFLTSRSVPLLSPILESIQEGPAAMLFIPSMGASLTVSKFR